MKIIDGKRVILISGTYSFVGIDGKTYRVGYHIDKNGRKTYDKPQLAVGK